MLHVAIVNLLKPEDLEIVLSNKKYNKKSPVYDVLNMWLGTGLLTSWGDKWMKRRKLLTPAFHFTILQNFTTVFNKQTKNLVKNLEKIVEEPSIDIVSPITKFTLKSMAETSLGTLLDIETEPGRNYEKSLWTLGKICTYRATRPWFYGDTLFDFTSKSVVAQKCVKNLHDFTNDIINERKRNRSQRPDLTGSKKALLDLLLAAKEEGVGIDDEGIREEVDTFMFEGHDTTAAALSFILLTLANQSKVQEEVRQEIIEVLEDTDESPTHSQLQQLSYTERCIKECLRLYPSVPFIGREATEDIPTSTGYLIPKGAMIFIHIFDLHRNPSIYPDPLKFDPDRFLPENVKTRHPFAYIPFSAGPRNCIGQKFAMLEFKSVLCGILRKFVLEPFDRPEDVVFIVDLVLRSRDKIKVKLSPRL